jgi:hypothetical protein
LVRRLAALGLSCKDALSPQAYSVHDFGPLVGAEIVRRGAGAGGLEGHFARPPIVGLYYELAVRGAARDIVL